MRFRQSEVSLLVMALFILGALALSACGSSGDGGDSRDEFPTVCEDIEPGELNAYNPDLIGSWLLSNSTGAIANDVISLSFDDDWIYNGSYYYGSYSITNSVNSCVDTGSYYSRLHYGPCYEWYSASASIATLSCPTTSLFTGYYRYDIDKTGLSMTLKNSTYTHDFTKISD